MGQDSLEERISQIEARNRRVEASKAWEGSFLRKSVVALSTYIVMVLVMSTMGVKDAFVSAIIPTLGFLLSTLSLSFVKDYWIKYIYKK